MTLVVTSMGIARRLRPGGRLRPSGRLRRGVRRRGSGWGRSGIALPEGWSPGPVLRALRRRWVSRRRVARNAASFPRMPVITSRGAVGVLGGWRGGRRTSSWQAAVLVSPPEFVVLAIRLGGGTGVGRESHRHDGQES